ncbi:MAG TPA: sigma-70 family RNA polymerase sigma factor [Candidatus Binatia bacterium]|nr:sigma-70 family RNA polymerase sigma factor [Candidatus Binatia bacterium]
MVPDDPVGRAAVEAVLGGDRDAFRILVEREAPGVVRACHRILGDPHEAEDVAQEAFVTAYRSLSTWRGDGPFGAWITRIAVRLALRQASRRRPVVWIDPLGGSATTASSTQGGGGSVVPPLVAPAGHDPAIAAERGEREAAVRAAVAALEEPYREVVALRFFGELSLAEIATASDRPIGTVKTHLHRGLLRLRAALIAAGDIR